MKPSTSFQRFLLTFAQVSGLYSTRTSLGSFVTGDDFPTEPHDTKLIGDDDAQNLAWV